MDVLKLIGAFAELLLRRQRGIYTVGLADGHAGVVAVYEHLVADLKLGDRCLISGGTRVGAVVQIVCTLLGDYGASGEQALGVACVQRAGSLISV